MEDLTLALITLTSFVLLFVVAIFADRAGAEMDDASASEPMLVQVEDSSGHGRSQSRIDAADVA